MKAEKIMNKGRLKSKILGKEKREQGKVQREKEMRDRERATARKNIERAR